MRIPGPPPPTRTTRLRHRLAACLTCIGLAASAACSAGGSPEGADVIENAATTTTTSAAPATSATSAPPDVAPPTLIPGPCLDDFAGSVREVECGTVELPQDRDDRSRGTVTLAVARIHAPGGGDAAPLVYLPGGPGDSALTTIAGLLQDEETAAIFGRRDWIVFDPRGTGASEPRVACPVVDELPPDAQVAAAAACAERLTAAGIALDTYNSATLAADARDVRLAFGLPRWHVFAVSYGTRVALQLMRTDADAIRSVVLDGPYPATVGFNDRLDVRPTAAFEQLFADCAADAACGDAFPDLRARVVAMVDRLNASPVTVDGFRFTGDFAVIVAARALYQYTPGEFSAPAVPRALSAAADGDLGPLAELAAVNFGADETSAGSVAADTTVGMGRAVQCHDEIPFLDRDVARAQAATYPFGAAQARYDGDVEFDVCAVFGAGAADPSFRSPVTSSIPTLILTGTYDPTTPTVWADETAATLDGAQLVRFAGVGHVIITTGACPVLMVQQFLDQPSQPVDRTCVADYRPEFDTRPSP